MFKSKSWSSDHIKPRKNNSIYANMSSTYNFYKQYDYNKISNNINNSIKLIQKRKTYPNHRLYLQHLFQVNEYNFEHKLNTEFRKKKLLELNINLLLN